MEDKKVIVTKIWSDIFGEENSDYDDNFFELGGDSIMALKMSEQLKQKGYTISLMEVFDESHAGRSFRFSQAFEQCRRNIVSHRETETLISCNDTAKMVFP